jgi:hypothetical protein
VFRWGQLRRADPPDNETPGDKPLILDAGHHRPAVSQEEVNGQLSTLDELLGNHGPRG